MNTWGIGGLAVVLGLGWIGVVAGSAQPAGRVVIAQAVDPTTLDAMNQAETPTSNVTRHLYDTLLERDRDLRLVPALAAELPRAIAPTTWEVRLRTGVRFHDGEAFDAESVRFSLHRLTDPANRLRGNTGVSLFDRVEVIDSHTVRIHTRRPWPILPKLLALPQTAMYPPRAYAGKDSAAISRSPVGTGPYRLGRWSKDEELLLEAHDGHWRGAPRIRAVVFRPIPDDAVRIAALQNGEVDLAVNVPPHLAPLIDRHPRLRLLTVPSGRTIHLMLQTHEMDARHRPVGPFAGPTADRRVRAAVAAALDVGEVARQVLDGRAIRLAGLLTPHHVGFDPGLRPRAPDPARATQLLAEAGFANGIDLVLNTPQGRYLRDREVAEALAGQLTRVGLRTAARAHEWGTFLQLVYSHRPGPVWLTGWGVAALDPETVYAPLFRTGSPLTSYHNPEVDRLIDEASTTMDEAARLARYQRVGRLLLDDVAVIPLYQPTDLYGVTRRLGWRPRPDEVIRADEMVIAQGR